MSTARKSEAFELFSSMLKGHETEFHGLHPFLQEQARKYQSVVAEAGTHFENAEVMISRAWLVKAYFDGVQNNENWKDSGWSAKPKRQYVFERAELGSLPKPELLTIPSPTTANTMLCMVAFKQVNRKGFGEPRSADFFQLGMYDSADEAEFAMWELSEAIKFLMYDLPSELSRLDEVAEKKDGGRWSDTPDF
jgi:hypothetical protein